MALKVHRPENDVGKNIKKYRKIQGLTQAQLGEKLGITQQTVAQFENGRSPQNLETIDRIAQALNVTRHHLILDDESKALIGIDDPKPMRDLFPEEAMRILEGEDTLISNYRKLNYIGKEEAQKRVSELTEIPRYTKEEK